MADHMDEKVACTCQPIEGRDASDSRGCRAHPMLSLLDEVADLRNQLDAAKIINTAVSAMADRAAREGYNLDPHDVLEAVGGYLGRSAMPPSGGTS